MRKILISVQVMLLGFALIMLYMLCFYDFGKRRELELDNRADAAAIDTIPKLDQLRTWCDLIVQRTLFSAGRGNAAAAQGEAWAKEGPPFQLMAIMNLNGNRGAIIVPNGADMNTYQARPMYNGAVLMKDVSIVEVREKSVVIRKPDGLFEMRLPRSGVESKVKVSTVQ